MSTQERLDKLLSLWQKIATCSGGSILADILCQDDPDLLPELRQRIAALPGMSQFVQEAKPATVADMESKSVEEMTGSFETSVMPLVPGYAILDVLGRGGMGVVYKARQEALGRIVALKMIVSGTHAGPDERARFLAEAAAVAQLHHPNIVQLYDFGRCGNLPYITLEFVEGGTLHARLKNGPVLAEEAARLIEQLALGMAHAHQHGIIHRDLKPVNILLGSRADAENANPAAETAGTAAGATRISDVVPKISDFGLVKRLDEGEGLTATGAVVGSPEYMSPEQARGDKNIGPAADIYALGSILYVCLTGRTPFQGPTLLDTLSQVKNNEPVPPSHLQPRLPRDLETICLRCLHKEPQRRYASAQALAEDLRCFQAGEPIHARPVSQAERTAKWIRRHPAVSLLVSAIALVTLAGLLGIGWAYAYALHGWGVAEDEKQRADDKTEEALTNEQTALHQKQIAEKKTEETLAQKKIAEKKTEEALAQKKKALQQWWRAEGLFYNAKIAQTHNDHQTSDLSFVFDRLGQCRWDLRGWDHDFLWGTCQRTVQTFSENKTNFLSVAFSPDGTRLAAAMGKMVKVWDLAGNAKPIFLTGHTGSVSCVAFSPNGAKIASANSDQSLRIWDADGGKPPVVFTGHTGAVTSVAFSPDGKRVASASFDKTVKVWDLAGGKSTETFIDHTGPVMGVAFSRDGNRIASGSSDKTVKVWDIAGIRQPLSLDGHTSGVQSVAFSPDGSRIASGGWDNTIKVWDAQGGMPQNLKGHTDLVTSVAFNHDGSRIVSGSADSTVKVWSTFEDKALLTLKGHSADVQGVTFSSDGTKIASASIDSTVRVWDAAGGKDPPTFTGHSETVYCVAIHPAGTQMVSGGADASIKLWDLTGEKKPRSHKGHSHIVNSLAYSPDGTRIASGSSDKTVKIWDAADGKEMRTLKDFLGSVISVAFSPDGTRIACGSAEMTIKIWDVAGTNKPLMLRGHKDVVWSVAFSPDGTRIASASADKTIMIFDLVGSKEPLTLKGHTDGVASVAFSPDGARVASAGLDKTIRIWDTFAGKELLKFQGHTKAVNGVAFSPDGNRIVSGSSDKTVKVW